MHRLTAAVDRHPGVVLGLMLLGAAGGAVSARHLGIDNGIEVWIESGSSQLADYRRFVSTFGSDEFVLVATAVADPYAPWLDELAGALRGLEVVDEVYWPRQIRDTAVSSEAAERLLSGLMIGADGRTVGVVCTLTAEGLANRRSACRQIRRRLSRADFAGRQFHLGGPPVFNAELDRASRESLKKLLPWVLVVCLAVLMVWTRNPGVAIVPLLVAGCAGAIVLGVVALTGQTLNMVMAILPPLVIVLSLATSIHVINYYRQRRRAGETPQGAAIVARHLAARPCLLAAMTTAVGLASLCTSRMGPVRSFGLFGAVAAMIAWLVGVLVTPALLQRFGRPGPIAGRAGRSRQWFPLSHPGAVLVGSSIAVLGLTSGVAWMPLSIDPFHYFDSGSRFARDYEFIESRLTGLAAVEVVLGFGGHVGPAAKAAVVRREAGALQGVPETAKVVSGTDVMGLALPQRPSDWANLWRSLRSRRAGAGRAWLDRYISRDGRRWRVSARVAVSGRREFSELAETLSRRARETADDDAGVTVTGVVPLLDFVQHDIRRTLIESFAAALGIIAAFTAVVFRSVRTALVALVPNLIPIGVTFGAMAWLGIPLDVGTMMIASVAIGIGVDDTIHLLVRVRSVGRLREALAEVAPAMVVTSVTAAAGFGILGISEFRPTAHFGLLLGVALLAALAGDLVVLPAMLANRGALRWAGVQLQGTTHEAA